MITASHAGSILTITRNAEKKSIDLKFKIGQVLVVEEKVMVRFECVGKDTPGRNVLCLNSEGEKVWQIEEPATWRTALWKTYNEANDLTKRSEGIRRDFLNGVWMDKDGSLWAGGGESIYRINMETGKILEEVYTK